MAIAYLSAGSNLGERTANLDEAVAQLDRIGSFVRRVSSVYETEPVGFRDQPWFLNIAVEIETVLSPLELLDHCQAIEQDLGRIRTFQDAPRTLDLDILLYDDLALDSPKLTVPHPRMAERRFVLAPLAEIAPEVLHPILRQTIRTLLDACPDRSDVRSLGKQ